MAPPPIPATEEKMLTKNTRKLPDTSLLALPVNKEDLKQRVEDEEGQDAHWHAVEHCDSIKDALHTGAAMASIGQITLGVARSDAEDLQTHARSARDISRAGGTGRRVHGMWEGTRGATEPCMSVCVCARVCVCLHDIAATTSCFKSARGGQCCCSGRRAGKEKGLPRSDSVVTQYRSSVVKARGHSEHTVCSGCHARKDL